MKKTQPMSVVCFSATDLQTILIWCNSNTTSFVSLFLSSTAWAVYVRVVIAASCRIRKPVELLSHVRSDLRRFHAFSWGRFKCNQHGLFDEVWVRTHCGAQQPLGLRQTCRVAIIKFASYTWCERCLVELTGYRMTAQLTICYNWFQFEPL